MSNKNDKTLESTFGLISIRGGRATVKKMLDGGACVPVTIEAVISDTWGHDDGIDQEFELRVTKFTPHGRVQPFIACKHAKAGVKVVTDSGFTCLPENAVRVIKRDKDGLYINCKDGHHYLDGQFKDVLVRGNPPKHNEVFVGLYKAN